MVGQWMNKKACLVKILTVWLLVSLLVGCSSITLAPNEQQTFSLEQETLSDNQDATIQTINVDDLEDHVKISFTKYNDHGWQGSVSGHTSGTKAGGKWHNYENQLPELDDEDDYITYREFDVNNKIEGQNRDAERFVVGSDGSVYFTMDHYETFIKIIIREENSQSFSVERLAIIIIKAS